MTTAQPLIGIVILNWNKADETIGCLKSVAQLTYPNLKVVLIENGSRDNSPERIRARFPALDILPLADNIGYGRAVNVGLTALLAAGVDYTFQLDNDARPAPDLFERLLAAMDADPRLAIAAPIIYRRDLPGTIAALGAVMEPRRVVALGENVADTGQFAGQPSISVDFVYGCGLLARRSVLDEIGLLDPRFFLYYEDMDLCWRARLQGYRVACVTTAGVWHQGSVSAQGAHYHKDSDHAQSRIRFFQKHLAGREYRQFVAAELRYLLSIAVRRLARGDLRGARAYLGGALRELLSGPSAGGRTATG